MAEENLFVKITGSGKDLINEFKKVGDSAESSGKQTASGWDKAKQGIKVAGAAIAGTAIAIAAASVEMADKYEVAHARMITALKNTGTSWAAQKKAIDAVSDAATRFGYTKTDVEGALAQMTTGMGSASKAMKNFQLVEDLAAKTGKPLADAAMAITKASQGQLRPLKQMGIDLPIAAGGALKMATASTALKKAQDKLATVNAEIHGGLVKGLSAWNAYGNATNAVQAAQTKLSDAQSAGSDILTALGQKLGGAAAEQADTFGGKVKALKAQLSNMGITIGMALMPVLIKLANIISEKLIPFFQKHTGYAKALGIVLGVTLVAAAVAYTASMVGAAAATIAATWPILAVLGAGALLIIGLGKLGVSWDKVQKGWDRFTQKPLVAGAVTAIKDAVNAVGDAADTLAAKWPAIWSGIQNGVISALNAIIRVYNDTIGRLTGQIDTLKHAAASVPVVPPGGATQYAPGTIGPQKQYGPGSTYKGPSLPTHGQGLQGPPVPTGFRAGGGNMLPFRTYRVGERGPETLTMGGSAGFVTPNGGGAATHVHVHLSGFAIGNERQLGQVITDAVVRYQRSSGRKWQTQGASA